MPIFMLSHMARLTPEGRYNSRSELRCGRTPDPARAPASAAPPVFGRPGSRLDLRPARRAEGVRRPPGGAERADHPEMSFRPSGSRPSGTALTDQLSPFIIAVT
jgi:hypothetical protein